MKSAFFILFIPTFIVGVICKIASEGFLAGQLWTDAHIDNLLSKDRK